MQNVTMNWDTENKMQHTLGGGKANRHLSGIYAEVEACRNNDLWSYRVVDLYQAETVVSGVCQSAAEGKRRCEPVVARIYSARA